MIYLDTSVVLAQLLAEDRKPPASLWGESLIASRLVEYETWTRIHARRLADTHGSAVRELLARVSFLELSPIVLERALEPFPAPVRTLDALHLVSSAPDGRRSRKHALRPRLTCRQPTANCSSG